MPFKLGKKIYEDWLDRKKQQLKKKDKLIEEKSLCWKGDDAGYFAIHAWVVKRKGKASEYKCVNCGKQAQDWSNIDHSWKRCLDDYSPRCRECHSKYDKSISKCILTHQVGLWDVLD